MSDVVILYLWVVFCGALAGFIRFNESKEVFKIRTIFTSLSIGAMTSFVVIGYYYSDRIVEQPIKCLAIAVAIGFSQPSIIEWTGAIIKILKDRNGNAQN